MPNPKGSLPAPKGFVEAECEFRARERVSARRITPTRGVRVGERACASGVCTCGEVCARGVGSGAARWALGEAGEREVARSAAPRGPRASPALQLHHPGARGGATGPRAQDHRPPAAVPRGRSRDTRGRGADAASLRTPVPRPGLSGPRRRPDLHVGRAPSRPERAARGAPEAVPGRARGPGAGAAGRARLPAPRGPGAGAPRRERVASRTRRRDPEAEAQPPGEPSRCPRCPPAPAGGPGGWMGSGGAGRGRRWARSRAR